MGGRECDGWAAESGPGKERVNMKSELWDFDCRTVLKEIFTQTFMPPLTKETTPQICFSETNSRVFFFLS